MFLMNNNMKVLWFDKEDYVIEVINNEMLPYQLRDNIKSSSVLQTMKEHLRNFDLLRHFFADRVLCILRSNAKAILQSINESQHLTEEHSYQLSLRCRGLSVSDNFWVKDDNEEISFKDVNLRNVSLNDSVFQVSMQGNPVSLQHSVLSADISTKGMFRKTWVREKDGLYLYKSDKTNDYINTKVELKVSKYLDNSNISHVKYSAVYKDGVYCCRSKCFTTDDISFVDAEYVIDWLFRTGSSMMQFIRENFESEFANMVVVDYIFANTDRHCNNWGFLVDAKTNKIISLAPLFDHNQALLALELGHEDSFDSLIYDPVGGTMLASFEQWKKYSNIRISNLPENLEKRLRGDI